ncbi:hypothetical protein IGI04_040681 [Brassica rapa subsp. trilocularis]|uniref:Uncharacterized protein n=1 Tax=Brassica rapa subsp. trilocularis TaxID=1813537 RepID=A0ABQ7KRH5_BRACM|nr:hypothetical protein IGI04_040681 [Brassica rapa subsp. trilocularis]
MVKLHKPSTVPEHGLVRRKHRDSFFITCKRGETIAERRDWMSSSELLTSVLHRRREPSTES